MRIIKIFSVLLFICLFLIYVLCSVKSSTWDILQWTETIKNTLVQFVVGAISISVLITLAIEEL